MPKLIKDLTNEELDYWAARMQGWEVRYVGERVGKALPSHWLYNGRFVCDHAEYHPTTNGGQAVELAAKFYIQTGWNLVEGVMTPWASPADAYPGVYGATLSEAIVRAALTAHYGEEVPDE